MSDEKVFVSSVAYSMIATPKDPLVEAIMYSIYKGSNLTGTIMDNAIYGGLGLKMKRVLDYAQDNFPACQPTMTVEGRAFVTYIHDAGSETPESTEYRDLGTYTSDIDSFLPFLQIRRENVDITTEAYEGTNEYTHSSRILRKLGLSYSSLGSQLAENPDVDQVDNAYVLCCIPLNAEIDEANIYLAEFFSMLATLPSFEYTPADGDVTGMAYTKVYFRALDIVMSLRFNLIKSEMKSGTLGKVGTVTKEYSNVDSGINLDTLTDGSIFIIRIQRTETTYEQITCEGMMHINELQGRLVATRLLDISGEDSENRSFLIPVDFDLLDSYNLFKLNMALQDSMYIVLNGYEIVHLKWYQTGWFKVLIMAVVMVISVISFQHWLGGLAAVYLEQGLMAFLMAAVPKLVIAFAVQMAFKFAAEHLGAEAVMILAAVIAIAGLGAKMTGVLSAPNSLITADQCLSLSSAVLKGGQAEVVAQQEAFTQEVDTFTAMQEDLLKELTESLELLENNSPISSLLFVDAAPTTEEEPLFLSETPQEFYYRTIHAGNIGVTTLDNIESFHDNMLSLPKPLSINKLMEDVV